jgi:sedoheptulokinase
MDALAENTEEASLLVNTLFAGSRTDPSARGNIQNIAEDNFTPAQLTVGFLNGAVQELYKLYLPLRNENEHKRLIGAGNGIRKSKPLKKILAQKFGMPLEIPLYQEEAAYGAALFALTCTGYFETVFHAQRLVRYIEN